jgi:phosphoglycolate phosphatase
MISAIIFDLDMTLIDSLEACTIGANLMAKRFGLEQKTPDQVLKSISLPTEKFWIELWGEYNLSWVDYFNKEILPQVAYLMKLYPEAEDIMKSAKNKGILLALATNRTNPWHDLAYLNIAKYFDTAVGASDVPRPKPEPDILHAVLRQLGVNQSDALFVGDSLSDMKCAASAGIKALGLLQGGANSESLYLSGADIVRPTLALSRDVLNC